eukprot:2049607-Rhodomonas_salina.1
MGVGRLWKGGQRPGRPLAALDLLDAVDDERGPGLVHGQAHPGLLPMLFHKPAQPRRHAP